MFTMLGLKSTLFHVCQHQAALYTLLCSKSCRTLAKLDIMLHCTTMNTMLNVSGCYEI